MKKWSNTIYAVTQRDYRKRCAQKLGQNIELQLWRVKNGRTQAEVAELFGVQQPTVSNWEHGRAPTPARVMKYIRKERFA